MARNSSSFSLSRRSPNILPQREIYPELDNAAPSCWRADSRLALGSARNLPAGPCPVFEGKRKDLSPSLSILVSQPDIKALGERAEVGGPVATGPFVSHAPPGCQLCYAQKPVR